MVAITLATLLSLSFIGQGFSKPCGGQQYPIGQWPGPASLSTTAVSRTATTTTLNNKLATSAASSVAEDDEEDIWQPSVGDTWNYQLSEELTTSTKMGDIQVWAVDLFANEAKAIEVMQNQGAHVICYFSAGSWEDWRPDASNFSKVDIGKGLDGWPGENWLNVKSDSVRQIMLKRLDMAVEKGCDGVDPDNVDGFQNVNGLGLKAADSISYMKFLANAAHDRGLAIGLKNAGDIVPSLVDDMEWSVNEQCAEFDECDTFLPFIKKNKPVFHVEYPKGDKTNNNVLVIGTKKTKACSAYVAHNFSTIIKNMNLNTWIQMCY